MTPSMNLTVERGPSVWDKTSCRSNWPAAAVATGVSVAALSYRAAPRYRFWLASAAAAAATYALFSRRIAHRIEDARVSARERARAKEPLDRTLKDSFPASDPPSV